MRELYLPDYVVEDTSGNKIDVDFTSDIEYMYLVGEDVVLFNAVLGWNQCNLYIEGF